MAPPEVRAVSRAPPATDAMIDGVVMNQRSSPAAFGAETFGQHFDHAIEFIPGEISIRPGGADEFEKFVSSQSSVDAAATICCASTSSGFSGMIRRSSSPRRTQRNIAAHSTSSSRLRGKIRPFGNPPRCVRPGRRVAATWRWNASCPVGKPDPPSRCQCPVRATPSQPAP